MGTPNWANRTIFTGDNLDIMRGMNSETVDLIYLDPPFNSNRNYSAPVGSAAAGAAFKDTWTLSDLDVAWMGLIADQHPAIYKTLEAAGLSHGKGMQSYLCMMAVRLLEMRRVMKNTGSVYLHCDPTASHYLKLVMDAVFGAGNFRSEIIWKRTTAHSDSRQGRRQHGRIHDVILFYTKSQEWTWNTLYTEYDREYIEKNYRYVEPGTNRRYRLDNISGPGGAAKGNPLYEVMGVTRYWRYSEERMQELIDAGRIVQSKPGAVPSYKRYLDEMPGVPLQDSWADIGPIGSRAKERLGYPTQKPHALLERIIAASSKGDDIVLDPFAGCATACVAAETLSRQWVGIDLSRKAVELVNYRLKDTLGSLYHYGFVTSRTDIPKRTDVEKTPNYRQNKHVLFGRQEGVCNGCKMDFPFKIYDVDHVIPKSRGGSDHIDNLQLLCSSCNRIKGDRPMEYLMAQLAQGNAPTAFR
ncbi:MAG: DNA methyltransferase [Chloroflexota bacterium]|nr:DNA methyltransferase [Chloroflexota bacterium]MDE2841401.1 DNA methyltransferase [Chloroflexota bacterium]MDE2929347.1 DNA methyltransferase [Chloroflexota bacterium]